MREHLAWRWHVIQRVKRRLAGFWGEDGGHHYIQPRGVVATGALRTLLHDIDMNSTSNESCVLGCGPGVISSFLKYSGKALRYALFSMMNIYIHVYMHEDK